MEGFDVTGVEIEPKIAALYKHRVIVADICSLNPEDFKGYDLIVGSPPCRDFTIFPDGTKTDKVLRNKWKDPKNPERGLKLVNAFLNIIEVAKPKFWLLENVPALQKYLKIEPRTICYIGPYMRRAFFGNFPAFLVPRDYTKGYLSGGRARVSKKLRKCDPKYRGLLGSWERARIPLPVARALGVAVKNALETPG